MRYVICVVVLALVVSRAWNSEPEDIARRIQERDEEYRSQLLDEQESLTWLE